MYRTLFLGIYMIVYLRLVAGQTFTSIVNTKSGPVRGIISTTIENVKYAAFRGIPYAKPPIKELRFKPPLEVDAWTDVYDATNHGSICMQLNSTTKLPVGSEDCLFVNIYTPHTVFNGSISKPVMVWIYGGAFVSGNSNQYYYGPDFILGEDVIMVSFNYRLGAFGFLNLEHENATGNCGLKDQNLALKWVKKNIAQFGGNPDKITIFGHSAGGTAVGFHVLSDMSVGLFNQSISMSGPAHCSIILGLQSSSEAAEQAFLLGTKLGINTNNKDTLLKVLYEASAADIILASNSDSKLIYGPSLERVDIAPIQEKFLTDCSLNKFTSGNYTKGPHIVGITRDESLLFAKGLNDTLNNILSGLNVTGRLIDNIFFWTNFIDSAINRRGRSSEGTVYSTIKKMTDLVFILATDVQQKLMSRNNDHPIYYYRFSFNSKISKHRIVNNLNGVAHADDLPYLFYIPSVNLPLNNPAIAVTRKRIVKLWTNFAKYGNPTPNGKHDEILGITWPDSRPNGEHLEIGNHLSIGPRPIDIAVKLIESTGVCSLSSVTRCTHSIRSNDMNR